MRNFTGASGRPLFSTFLHQIDTFDCVTLTCAISSTTTHTFCCNTNSDRIHLLLRGLWVKFHPGRRVGPLGRQTSPLYYQQESESVDQSVFHPFANQSSNLRASANLDPIHFINCSSYSFIKEVCDTARTWTWLVGQDEKARQVVVKCWSVRSTSTQRFSSDLISRLLRWCQHAV